MARYVCPSSDNYQQNEYKKSQKIKKKKNELKWQNINQSIKI